MNAIDYLFLVIILIFVVKSSIHGFIVELVAMLSFLLSALITYGIAPLISVEIVVYLKIIWLANFLAYGLCFIATLLLINKLLYLLLKNLKFGSTMNTLLGSLLGLLTGMLIVITIVIVFNYLIDRDTQPKILSESIIKNKIEKILY